MSFSGGTLIEEETHCFFKGVRKANIMISEQEKERVEYVVFLEIRVCRPPVKWHDTPSVSLGVHLIMALVQLLA